jgi:hypothetical protein
MSIPGDSENVSKLERYISVPQAILLIPKPFDGNPTELRKFIQNVESTCEVVDPLDVLLFLNLYMQMLQMKRKLNYYLEHI